MIGPEVRQVLDEPRQTSSAASQARLWITQSVTTRNGNIEALRSIADRFCGPDQDVRHVNGIIDWQHFLASLE